MIFHVIEELDGTHDIDPVGLQAMHGVVGVLKTENEDRLVAALEREGIHVLDVDSVPVDYVEDFLHPATQVTL